MVVYLFPASQFPGFSDYSSIPIMPVLMDPDLLPLLLVELLPNRNSPPAHLTAIQWFGPVPLTETQQLFGPVLSGLHGIKCQPKLPQQQLPPPGNYHLSRFGSFSISFHFFSFLFLSFPSTNQPAEYMGHTVFAQIYSFRNCENLQLTEPVNHRQTI